jgi:hypothetical protein
VRLTRAAELRAATAELDELASRTDKWILETCIGGVAPALEDDESVLHLAVAYRRGPGLLVVTGRRTVFLRLRAFSSVPEPSSVWHRDVDEVQLRRWEGIPEVQLELRSGRRWHKFSLIDPQEHGLRLRRTLRECAGV